VTQNPHPAAPLLPRIPLYLLMSAVGIADVAIVPLVPLYKEHLHLTAGQLGILLAVSPLILGVLSIYIGSITDRVGWRRLTMLGSMTLTLGCLGQGFASTFALLVVGRLLNGIATALIATALIPGVVSSCHDENQRTRALALVPIFATGAFVVGPAMIGYLGVATAIWVPFAILAVGSAILTVWLYYVPDGMAPPTGASLRRAVSAARHSSIVQSALIVFGVSGLLTGTVFLLVPLLFVASGSSAASIGLGFSIGAVLGIFVTLIVRSRGTALTRPRTAAVAVLLIAVALLTPLLVVGFVAGTAIALLRSAIQPSLGALSFAMASKGAYASGAGLGAMTGLGNAVWAFTYAAVAPVLGLLVGGVGLIATSGMAALLFAVLAVILVRGDSRARRQELLESGLV
jgi:predicted MFS family arabinose efflux permease